MAKTDQAHGVYVLICLDPGHVEVVADREMRDKGFQATKERQLATEVAKGLRGAGNEKTADEKIAAQDKALLNAVQYLRTNLPSANADVKKQTRQPTTRDDGKSAQGPDRSGGGWLKWICIGVAVLAGIWVIFAIIRAFSGGGTGTAGPGGGGFGGGGGGFMSSMLGGLFGAAAGMWVYDQFFGGRSHSGDYYGGNTNYGDQGGVTDEGAGDFSGDPGAGADFDGDSGGGADFGDAGGGDFGGGDAGGGDFGGGDFGGGGDGGGSDF